MEDITHFYISKAYIVLFYPASKEDMNYHTLFFSSNTQRVFVPFGTTTIKSATPKPINSR
jgi:hypothetical protein